MGRETEYFLEFGATLPFLIASCHILHLHLIPNFLYSSYSLLFTFNTPIYSIFYPIQPCTSVRSVLRSFSRRSEVVSLLAGTFASQPSPDRSRGLPGLNIGLSISIPSTLPIRHHTLPTFPLSALTSLSFTLSETVSERLWPRLSITFTRLFFLGRVVKLSVDASHSEQGVIINYFSS